MSANEYPPEVCELLALYPGPYSREAFKCNPKPAAEKSALLLLSQLPDHLEAAYDIALGNELVEHCVLKPEDQLTLYRRLGIYDLPQDQPWPVFPSWADALVVVTEKGRAVLASRETSKCGGQLAELVLPPLTDNDARILVYLQERHPHLEEQEPIAAALSEAVGAVTRKTVGERLRRLEKLGLVHRPEGERKGFGLTTNGEKVAKSLPNLPGR
jgi:DNA-binding MarR family transcriptional regulator